MEDELFTFELPRFVEYYAADISTEKLITWLYAIQSNLFVAKF